MSAADGRQAVPAARWRSVPGAAGDAARAVLDLLAGEAVDRAAEQAEQGDEGERPAISRRARTPRGWRERRRPRGAASPCVSRCMASFPVVYGRLLRARRRFVTSPGRTAPAAAGRCTVTASLVLRRVMMRTPDPSDEQLYPERRRVVQALLLPPRPGAARILRAADPRPSSPRTCAQTFAGALASRHRYRPRPTPRLGSTGSRRRSSPMPSAAACRPAHAAAAGRGADQAHGRGVRAHQRSRRAQSRPRPDGSSGADQREAVTAHVLDERPYGRWRGSSNVIETIVRKRVSRGLATIREWIGVRRSPTIS